MKFFLLIFETIADAIKLLLLPLRFLLSFRHRFDKFVEFRQIPEMLPTLLEGYTDKPFYKPGEKVKFFIKSELENNQLVIEKVKGPESFTEILRTTFPACHQKNNPHLTKNGCGWKKTLEITIDEKFTPGYYRAWLSNSAYDFHITFLVGAAANTSGLIVIAPVSTWTAFNPYGGKSFYYNNQDRNNVHYLALQRPNTALQYHSDSLYDITTEAYIFEWFYTNYGATLLPDFYLEKDMSEFITGRIFVLSHLCEYFTPKMYRNLRTLVENKRSLISLGAQQIYWKAKWNKDFSRLECRKDQSFFARSLRKGGLWRDTLKSEDKFLGVSYEESGKDTFAPYKLVNAKHWALEGLDVKKGELFGLEGINGRPLSGGKTDKSNFYRRANTDVLARGLNPSYKDHQEVYNGSKDWDGSGGGEIAIRYYSSQHAALSAGSLESGAGLGKDQVFTGIVKNFIRKYATADTMSKAG